MGNINLMSNGKTPLRFPIDGRRFPAGGGKCNSPKPKTAQEDGALVS